MAMSSILKILVQTRQTGVWPKNIENCLNQGQFLNFLHHMTWMMRSTQMGLSSECLFVLMMRMKGIRLQEMRISFSCISMILHQESHSVPKLTGIQLRR